ncbi:class I SAM-dependent methyltransferase [Rhizobium miluonense]|uniref:class I SAM-dependent methyltransferase n=1 Tax=Rhizobium miluonense TaxID=411945 RepID=UPI0038621102
MLSRIIQPLRGLFGGTARGTSASDLSSSLVTPTWINSYRGRKRRLRKHIELTTKVLEIGPLARPIAPKQEGYSSFSVDNTNRDGLLRRYAGHVGFNAEKVEEVDFIWSSGDLADAVSIEHHGTFEVIVLSHVLEHLPDPISFLNSCAKLLKDGGYVTLALPDKRHCFDLFRPFTTTGQWLAAFRQKSTFHDDVALFDYATLAVAKHGELAWSNSRHKIRDITFLNMSLEAAYERFFGDQARSPTATRTATLLCSPLRASRCWRRNAMQLG